MSNFTTNTSFFILYSYLYDNRRYFNIEIYYSNIVFYRLILYYLFYSIYNISLSLFIFLTSLIFTIFSEIRILYYLKDTISLKRIFYNLTI